MRQTLFTAFAAGLTFTAGFVFGADIATDNLLHAETFEVAVYEDYSMKGEPVDARWGFEIDGEGIAISNDVAEDFIRESGARSGDIVTVYWTQAQAENSDWTTPVKFELEEDLK